MKLYEVLPILIKDLIDFYIEINKRLYDKEIIIKYPELLYNDMYNRIYNEWINVFTSYEIYSVSLLNDINPWRRTYNKLSYDNNILETLVLYIEDYIKIYRPNMIYNDIILCIDHEVPFEKGIIITYGWLKQIIDIYK